MSLEVMDYYSDGTNLLSERLRKNWMQKMNAFDAVDDSLTNLTWLHDMHPVALDIEPFCRSIGNISKVDMHYDHSYQSDSRKPFAGSLMDPQVRHDYRTKWTGKPPFSYATLICLAMRELGKPKVTLSDIYGWIMGNFAYYRHTDSSWQNSVRHNLSLNKCFEKVPRDKNERGKGGFWRVNPKHMDWLEANLAKCRRAAPPPGPPPPAPRSWLYQQQQHQQLLSNDSTSRPMYNTLLPITSAAFAPRPVFNYPSDDSLTAKAPSTITNNSSTSSSPHSLASLPSPNGPINSMLRPVETDSFQGNDPPSKPVRPNSGTHRRKSPLQFYHNVGDDDFEEISISPGLSEEVELESVGSRSSKSSNSQTQSNTHDLVGDSLEINGLSIQLLDSGNVHPSNANNVSEAHSAKEITGVCQQKGRKGRQNALKKQAAPTRILPPRRRYSRWSRPRPIPPKHGPTSESTGKQTRSKLSSSTLSKQMSVSSRKANGNCSIAELDHSETEITWPLESHSGVQKAVSRSTTDYAHPVNTPHYVPSYFSPFPHWCAKPEAHSSSASSSSLSSARSSSDGHMYQTLSPVRHSTPRRVEIQTMKTKTTQPVHFGRLYPTSYDAQRYLTCSPDNQHQMPKWAKVFLPEDEQREFGPIFEKPEIQRSDFTTDTLLNQSLENETSNSVEHGTFSSFTSDPYSVTLESPLNGDELSNNSILEQLDLDLDSLHGLVEATGPIPLDLDLGLTAVTPYPNQADLCSTSDQMLTSNSGSTLHTPSPWFTQHSQYSKGTDEFEEVDAMFDKSVALRREYESNLSHGLNTPPSA